MRRKIFISWWYCSVIHVWLFTTPWTVAHHAPLFFTIFQNLLKFMSIESVKVKVAQLCPTLCDCMNYTIHGILQIRILEWVALSSPEDLHNTGIKTRPPPLQVDSLPAEPQGKPKNTGVGNLSLSSGSSRLRNQTGVSSIAGKFFTNWAIREIHPPPHIESVMLYNPLILCRPLLLWPSFFPSIRVFSNELALCIRWPKYWNFSFSISPSNEYSGLISFRIN